jgi:Cu(I)/Ag(I) efflux system membrane fusion protein
MEQLNALQAHSEKISQLSEIEAQREQFDFLSQALIKVIKVFGIPAGTFYVQHCPMAFNNEGADWISKDEQIRNPYFGDQMLTCGITQETITKDFRNAPTEVVFPDAPKAHNH